MSIYDYDIEIISEQLTPPILRKARFLAWMKVLFRPVQWLRDLIFNTWANGSTDDDWSSMLGYPYGARVVYSDKAVYECINLAGAAGNLQSPANRDYWVKVSDNFIGANQRVKFNSQIIIFEHALNKWFRIGSLSPQIYISNNTNPSVFIMGNTGPYSSAMASDSTFATAYMANAPTFTTTDFTVYVPLAVFNALGPTNTDREKTVRRFVDKYIFTGLTYTVTTY